MMPIDPDGESTTTWMLRAEKAEAELATKTALLNDLANIVEDFRNVLETIANNYDIDPRAEAREALTPSPKSGSM